MNFAMNRMLTTIIVFSFFTFQACVTGTFSTREKQPEKAYPAWAEQTFTNGSVEDHEIEYALKENLNTVEPFLKEQLGLVYDHVNKPVVRLTDYALPKRKLKPIKKPVKKKSSFEKKFGGRTLATDRGFWETRENVNILVNQLGQEKKEEKKTKPRAIPLSRVEERYNRYGELTKGKKIRQFGYNMVQFRLASGQSREDLDEDLIRGKKGAPIFSQDPATRLFSKSKGENAGFLSGEYSAMRPVASDYIIAPGDEVFIKITGPVDIAEVFAVDRNGILFIPKIGAVNLAGKKASDLQNLVVAKTKQVFVNAFIEASLGRLRSIQVTITGNVYNPGLIKVPANSSFLNALAAAGGPDKNGTLRKIELRRRNEKTQFIDLYGVLMDGDFNQDPPILPGDMIYVGPVGQTAAIMTPGDEGVIYETLEGCTLAKLAATAGLTGSFMDVDTILVERKGLKSDRRIISLDFKHQAESFILANGDIFQFFPTHSYAYNSVAIQGPVLRAGIYPYSDNMRVSDLLKFSRGFLVNASLDKALLIRELGKDRPFNIMPGDGRGIHRKQLIWLDLTEILAGSPEADHKLVRLDRLKIFTIKDHQPEPMVRIIGGARKPGEYHLTSGMTLGDLLKIAGGPSERAYDGESSIVRRRHSTDGKRHFDVKIIPFNLKDVINREKPSRILLNNNDKIVIRQVNNLEISAKIDGWVQFPGTYILPSGSRIDDLVKLAGGILPGVDLRAAVFKRRRVSQMERKKLNDFYTASTEHFARVRDEVTLNGNPSESLANQLSLLGQDRLVLNMKKFQTTGRVVINMTEENFPETENNMILEDGDSLTIPQKMTTVMVMGRIFNPSAYLWNKGLSVGDYLEKSGGYLEDADKERVYVVMANGEVKSAAQKEGRSKLLAFKPNPGDIVFVPQEALGRSTMAQIMDALQILRMVVGTSALGAAIPNMGKATPTIELKTDDYRKQNIINEFEPELYESYQTWQEQKEIQNE